jgi:hypothetical protein
VSREALQFIAHLRARSAPDSPDRRIYLINVAHVRPEELGHFRQRFGDLKNTVTNPNTDPDQGPVYLGHNHWQFRIQWMTDGEPATVNDVWLLPDGDALGDAINLLLDNSNYIKLKSLIVDEQQELVVPWAEIPQDDPGYPLVARVRFDTPPPLRDMPDQAPALLIKTAKVEGGWVPLAQGIYFTGFPGRWSLIWSVPDEASLNVVEGIFNQRFSDWGLIFDFGARVVP